MYEYVKDPDPRQDMAHTHTNTHTKCGAAKYFTLCNRRHSAAPNLDGVWGTKCVART